MWDGCWHGLHPDNKFIFAFNLMGKSLRLAYRPEIYYRDKQEFLYVIEKDNIEKEKVGQKPNVYSPIVLWH